MYIDITGLSFCGFVFWDTRMYFFIFYMPLYKVPTVFTYVYLISKMTNDFMGCMKSILIFLKYINRGEYTVCVFVYPAGLPVSWQLIVVDKAFAGRFSGVALCTQKCAFYSLYFQHSKNVFNCIFFS